MCVNGMLPGPIMQWMAAGHVTMVTGVQCRLDNPSIAATFIEIPSSTEHSNNGREWVVQLHYLHVLEV